MRGMADLVNGSASENGLLAFRAGGRGDLSGKEPAWRYARSVPQLPTTRLPRHLYMINDGGILTTFDRPRRREETGPPPRRHRPLLRVARGGRRKVYIVSHRAWWSCSTPSAIKRSCHGRDGRRGLRHPAIALATGSSDARRALLLRRSGD